MRIRVLSVLVSVLIVIFLPIPAMAAGESVEAMVADVVLEEDGTAQVTQTWQTHSESAGTYCYGLRLLDNSAVEDFAVEGPSGEYETLPSWDTLMSYDQVVGKAGIVNTGRNVQMCWAKASNGDNRYVLRWKIRNAVQGYTDYDGLKIQLVDYGMDPMPGQVTVNIRWVRGALNPSTTKMWSRGYEGSNRFLDDGTVVAQAKSLAPYDYMTLFMRFDKGLFNPTESGYGTFNSAVGVDRGEDFNYSDRSRFTRIDEPKSFSDEAIPVLIVLGVMALMWFLFSLLRYGLYKIFTPVRKYVTYGPSPYMMNIEGEKVDAMPSEKVRRKKAEKYGEWIRENPLNNNPALIYYVDHLVQPSMATWGNLMSAYMLKWVKMGAMTFQNWGGESKPPSRREIWEHVMILQFRPKQMDNVEAGLWQIMESAAGRNLVLEEKELEKYSKNHINVLKVWEKTAVIAGARAFLEMGGTTVGVKKKLLGSSYQLQLTPMGREKLEEFSRFRRYLADFTLLNEREIHDVHSWDDYLIIATIVGLGEQVSKQMESLRPDFRFPDGSGKSGGFWSSFVFSFVDDMSSTSYGAYQSATSASSFSDFLSSSGGSGGGGSLGGGGSSSIGGGGSSGGGGGGGSR